MAAPKRSKARDFLLDALIERDGFFCFLCGATHSRATQLQVDWVDNPSDDMALAFVACKPCVRRRDGKPLGGYMKHRMIEARREYDYLHGLRADVRMMEMFSRPIVLGPTEDDKRRELLDALSVWDRE